MSCSNCSAPVRRNSGTYTGNGLVCDDCLADQIISGSDPITTDAVGGVDLEDGNMLAGAIGGFMFGCIGVVVAMVIGGRKTKLGSLIGFGVNAVFWLAVGA